MSIIRKPRIEQISLPAFVARSRQGRSVKLAIIGYTETDTDRQRTKKIRTVAPGTMPLTWPKQAFGNVGAKNPSQPPPKHKAGFPERYLGKVIK